MAMATRTYGVIAVGVLAAAALAVALLRSGGEAPAPASASSAEHPAAEPAPAPAAASPSAGPAAPASTAPAPAASPSSRKTIAALERWRRLQAHTETYRLMALRVLRENRIKARLAELYCIDTVCRGTLVEGTPDEYARWADLMRSDTSTRFASFQSSLHTVDGNRRMTFSIGGAAYVPEPKAAP